MATLKERIKTNPGAYAKTGIVGIVAIVYAVAAFLGYVPPEGLKNIIQQLMSVLMFS